MKVIFFEVRSKTEVFSAVAERLKKIIPDLDMVWVIQNKEFSNGLKGKKYFLTPPSLKNFEYKPFDSIDEKVIGCDRFSLHFNVEPWYYKSYRGEVENIILDEEPDFLFGELGNFFTHYAALIAKREGIPFYDVESARFPVGCISFFQYDSWSPLKVRSVEEEEVERFFNEFIFDKPTPDYMKKNASPVDAVALFGRRIHHRAKILKSYLRDERFCTQNPLRNFLDKEKIKRKLSFWDVNSVDMAYVSKLHECNKKILLYPLQMQPEFNLEVWGYPYNDQGEVIKNLSESLPDDWVLVVKINPKSSFEMNRINISEIINYGNVVFLERNVPMQEVEFYADMVATVTGTVQIERLITNRPVYILGNTPFSKFSCIKKDILELSSDDFSFGEKYSLDNSSIKEICRFLLEHSCPGVMGEPVNNIECMERKNIDLLASAFGRVLGDEVKI